MIISLYTWCTKKTKDTRPTAQFRGRSYRNFNPKKFQNKLAEADWTEFYDSSDTDGAWAAMQNIIVSVLDLMCPMQTFHIKNYRPDWMTKGLIEQIKDRDYFYKQAKKTGDVDMWNIAKHLRNITNSHIRHAKRDFVLNELKQNENNEKRFWKVIRSVIPSNKSSPDSEIILRDGPNKIERTEVAHFINNYFINVGNFSPKPDVTTLQTSDTPTTEVCEGPSECVWNQVGELEVHKVVKSINVSKSSGLDNISSLVIKTAFDSLIPEVTFMYNLSFKSGMLEYPWSWL